MGDLLKWLSSLSPETAVVVMSLLIATWAIRRVLNSHKDIMEAKEKEIGRIAQERDHYRKLATGQGHISSENLERLGNQLEKRLKLEPGGETKGLKEAPAAAIPSGDGSGESPGPTGPEETP